MGKTRGKSVQPSKDKNGQPKIPGTVVRKIQETRDTRIDEEVVERKADQKTNKKTNKKTTNVATKEEEKKTENKTIEKNEEEAKEETGVKLDFCYICYGNVYFDNNFGCLHCDAVWHKECIEKWLIGDNNSCTHCQKEIKFANLKPKYDWISHIRKDGMHAIKLKNKTLNCGIIKFFN